MVPRLSFDQGGGVAKRLPGHFENLRRLFSDSLVEGGMDAQNKRRAPQMASLGGKAGIDAAGVALAGPCASIGRVQCRIEKCPGKAPRPVAVAYRASVQGDRGQGLSLVRNPSRRIDRESFFMGAASHHEQVRAGTLLALAKMVDAKLAFAPVQFATWTVAWNVGNEIAVRVGMVGGHHVKSVQKSLFSRMLLSVDLESAFAETVICQLSGSMARISVRDASKNSQHAISAEAVHQSSRNVFALFDRVKASLKS